MRAVPRLMLVGAVVLAAACEGIGDGRHSAARESTAPVPTASGSSPPVAAAGDGTEALPETPPGRGQAQVATLSSARDPQLVPRPTDSALVFGPWDRGGWTDLRAEPRDEADRIAQLLIGDRVRVLEQRAGWSRVVADGTPLLSGWVPSAHLTIGSPRVRQAYEGKFHLAVVAAPAARPSASLLLPFGAVLAMAPASCGAGVCALLPDGRTARLEYAQAALVGSLGLEQALEDAKGLRQGRYQLGGNTVEAMDAAGLVNVVFRVLGVALPRDLPGLLRHGREVPREEMSAGDVVFFRMFDPERPHPALLLDQGKTFLEASPASGVNIGFMEQMRNREIVAVRRYLEQEPPGSPSIPEEQGWF